MRLDERSIEDERESLQHRVHRLTARLIDVPRVNALRIVLRNRPCQPVFAEALRQLPAALRRNLLGIIEPHNAALGVQDHRGGNHWPEQRATPGLVQAGNARPAKFARRSLETGRAEAAHFGRDFSTSANFTAPSYAGKLQKQSPACAGLFTKLAT